MKEVEIDGRLKIKGEGKVFSNHTHVALSSSLTIFTLFLVLILQTVQGCLSLILKARSFNIKLCQWMLP